MRKPVPAERLDQEIRRISETIAAAAAPLAVFLFGSAARGEATDQSDFDFLVVVETVQDIKAAKARLRQKMPLSSFPVDLVWTTRIEFLRKRDLGGVCFDAWDEGRCTYCRDSERGVFEHDKKKKI